MTATLSADDRTLIGRDIRCRCIETITPPTSSAQPDQGTVAFREFEAVVTDYRASMIRALVEEDHMIFTEVGEFTGRLDRWLRACIAGPQTPVRPTTGLVLSAS